MNKITRLFFLLFVLLSLFSITNGQSFIKADLGFEKLECGSIASADYDMDGDFDLVYNGRKEVSPGVFELYIFFYINNGGLNFSKADYNLPNPTDNVPNNNSDDFIQWIDIDSDNCPELCIGGSFYEYEMTSDSFYKMNLQLNGLPSDFGDYDCDGDVDVICLNTFPTSIYRNNGNLDFELIQCDIPGIIYGTAVWLDYDNDKDLDILISGQNDSRNKYTRIFQNVSGIFIESDIILPDLFSSNLALGDFNGDGNPDIFLTGAFTEVETLFDIFLWNDSSYTRLNYIFPESWNGQIRTGDLNNDGRTDITFLGQRSFQLFMNESYSSITPYTIMTRENFNGYMFDVSDYNNDNKLDIISISKDSTLIYINSSGLNLKPDIPVNLSVTVERNNALLKWSASQDDLTSSQELTYNLFVHLLDSSDFIKSPVSDINSGEGFILKNGNLSSDTSWLLKDLRAGKYEWAVQAIDNSYNGSVFSLTDTFEIREPFSLYTFLNSGDLWSKAIWVDYDFDRDLDVVNAGQSSGVFENINNLFIDKGFSIEPYLGASPVSDFDSDGIIEILSSSKTYKLYKDSVSTVSDEIGGQAWGDFDNDGDLDILANDCIYINESNQFSVTRSIKLAGAVERRAYCDFVDLDNDMDLDIIQFIDYDGSYIYENLSDGNFKKYDNILPRMRFMNYPFSLGDIDNDGDIDILVAGQTIDVYNITKWYINNGKFNFQPLSKYFIGAGTASSSAVGDFDNNNLSDFIYNGSWSGFVSNIYVAKNNSFELFNCFTPEVAYGSVDWGDFDNDGDLDLIITGENYTYSRRNHLDIYQNNLNIKNNPPSVPQNLNAFKSLYGISLTWEASQDPQGGQNGLTYNLRIGKTPGGGEIYAPLSDPNSGFCYIPKMGNVQTNLGWKLDSLPEGKYYWSVQAIDQSFLGGPWAPEQTFTISVVRADFDALPVCFGAPTSFTDKTLTSGTPVTSWLWDFGDGSSSTIQNPGHTYSSAGEFSVKLIALSSEYSDTITKVVKVLPKPVASFSVDPVCHGNESVFQNNTVTISANIISWSWTFGDNQVYGQKDPPDHFYSQPGNFSVKLKVSVDNGCTDSITKIASVGEYPVVILSANGPLEFCSGSNVKLSVPKKDQYSYQWELNDIPVTDSVNSGFTAVFSGKYSVVVNNTTANCISNSPKVDVKAFEKPANPVVVFDGVISGLCPDNNTVVLRVDQSSALYSYQWRRNGVPIDNASGSELPGVIETGSYSVTASYGGCSVESNEIAISYLDAYPKPLLYVKGPAVWYMASSNDSAYQYQWYLNNELISGADKNIYVANQTTGTYRVAIKNEEGCVTMSDEVTIPVSKGAMTDFIIPKEYLVGEDIDPFENLKIYPNPTPGLFTVEMDNSIFGELSIDILTQAGAKVLNIRFEKTTSHFLTHIDLSGQPRGMYLVNLMLQEYFASRKLIVE